MKYGLIYIIKNKFHVENLFKVGFTTNSIEDRVHELNEGFSLNRFSKGYLLDEKGLGTKTWIS